MEEHEFLDGERAIAADNESKFPTALSSLLAKVKSMKTKSSEAPENAELQFAKAASTVTTSGSAPVQAVSTQTGEQVDKPCRGLVKTFMQWVKNFVSDVFHGRLDSLTQIVKHNLRTRRPGFKGFLVSVWKTLVDLLRDPKVQSAFLSIREALKHEVMHCRSSKRAGRKKINVNGSSLLAVEGAASFENTPENSKKSTGTDIEGGKKTPSIASIPSWTNFIPRIVPPPMVKWLVVRKWKMAFISMFIDLVGVSSNLLLMLGPIGPMISTAWAPVSAVWLKDMYNGSSRLFGLGIIEEMLPFVDILPTASIAWLYSYNRGRAFDGVRTMLNLPDRSRVGSKSCSEETLVSMKEKYVIKKDNEAGHVYLRCKRRKFLRRRKWQKASCVKEECGGNAGFCFVKNHCGGLRAGACIALKNQNPLKCAEGWRKRLHEGSKQEKKTEEPASPANVVAPSQTGTGTASSL
eukprot:TRINITY_DN30366_c0_g3_i3.p1 TRINITY_DN30366_c0_g3~~TRINITY_DN30366_c0_g3_i3.p1  ORF type:complete len:508 (+),score=42.26 TRINITY_DN30366_c0_g3_i3:137-1525(+)